jgi:DNA-binding NtrC family response regulator
MSHSLTLRARTERRPIWLAREAEKVVSESILRFEDAICVPLIAPNGLIGLLHAYRQGPAFRIHDVHFCEVVGRHLAGSLRLYRLRAQLETENVRLRRQATTLPTELVGSSTAMMQLRDKLGKAARTLSTVLLRGETGVGKELVATALHKQSARGTAPFVALNCGAIPPELVNSELFGHCKGAFTGAHADRQGCIRKAYGGTLFLDEVGDLPLECQVKLLRVIEGHAFTPVGSDEEISPDVRIVSATNKDLERAVEEMSFRQDFLYRINPITLQIPPLRERAEDIPELVDFFLKHQAARAGVVPTIAPAALAKLQAYHWPGNVRQLWGVLESAIAFRIGETIQADDLHFGPEKPTPADSLPLNLKQLEAWAVQEALRRSNQSISEAAKLLGIARQTMHDKIKRLGLTAN